MTAPAIFTIAPHTAFLPALADRLLDGTLVPGVDANDPFNDPLVLAECLIFLPTRRARLTLMDILVARSGGACILPQIRTLNEIETDALSAN
ncbi:MAG: hypothetical protein GXP01_00455, partial [Alphaproteobacteria bacterium]|nr:hypothetical protein [Alphaproteobacteria bacterium]